MGIHAGQLHVYINYDNDVWMGGCLPDHKPARYEDFARLFNNTKNIAMKFGWIDSSGNHLFEEKTSMPDIVTFGVQDMEVVQLSMMKKGLEEKGYLLLDREGAELYWELMEQQVARSVCYLKEALAWQKQQKCLELDNLHFHGTTRTTPSTSKHPRLAKPAGYTHRVDCSKMHHPRASSPWSMSMASIGFAPPSPIASTSASAIASSILPTIAVLMEVDDENIEKQTNDDDGAGEPDRLLEFKDAKEGHSGGEPST